MSGGDDFIAAFQLDAAPLRGRYVRLGVGVIDPILRRHAYPRPAALLLGEALTLAALCAALVKQHASLTLQAQGDGPAPLLVAEARAGGALRGYLRLAPEAVERLAGAHAMPPRALIGDGALAITLDPGGGLDQVQGVVPLEGESLAACVEQYFQVSEQTPTRVRLAVAESFTGDAPAQWRAGGAIMQRLAGDAARGDPEEDWRRACLLFETVTAAELTDPALPGEQLLHRLFHEEGVRMGPRAALIDQCPCDRGRLTAVLARYTRAELEEFLEADGLVHARCQFCARDYHISPDELARGPAAPG